MKKELTNEEKIEIEQKAFSLLKNLNLDKEKHIDTVKLAKRMGFIVWALDSFDEKDGFIITGCDSELQKVYKNDMVIGINENIERKDGRYLLAYLLSCYYVNKDKNNKFAYIKDNKKETDPMINHFVSSLLINEDNFKILYETLLKTTTLPETIKFLSDIYDLPESFIKNKIRETYLPKC